jgi:hypothetical protein
MTCPTCLQAPDAAANLVRDVDGLVALVWPARGRQPVLMAPELLEELTGLINQVHQLRQDQLKAIDERRYGQGYGQVANDGR